MHSSFSHFVDVSKEYATGLELLSVYSSVETEVASLDTVDIVEIPVLEVSNFEPKVVSVVAILETVCNSEVITLIIEPSVVFDSSV